MNLAEELIRIPPAPTVPARRVHLEEPPLRLHFNGALSADEKRMLEQFTFEDIPA
jgi:hypothetical protein